MHFTATEVGLVGSAYLIGAVTGAVLFGYLTDRFGRKRLFMVTLGIYLTATAATALSWNFWSFAVFRVLTGAGIGGEYTAINSAIQELIPARFRGRTDLAINGSFWLGAALGAGGAIALLHPGFLPPDWGWRAAFGIGAVLGLIILGLRQFIPESPRWLILHGRAEEAENVTKDIERRVAHAAETGSARTAGRADSARCQLAHAGRAHDPGDRARLSAARCSRPGADGLAGVFLNAIFFTYALVLTKFYGVPSGSIGWYILPFALGNFCGPLLLGPLFDRIGRKPMIASTYAISGVLLAIVGYFFREGAPRCLATDPVLDGDILFRFGGGECGLPDGQRELSDRSQGIGDRFLLCGRHGLGGVVAPWLFGTLVASGERSAVSTAISSAPA